MSPIYLQQLRRWSQGNRFSAAHLNEGINALGDMLTQMSQVGDGADPPALMEAWVGTIVDKGPNGETLTGVGAVGEQYWVQRNFIVGSAQNTPITLGADGPGGVYDSVSDSTGKALPEIFIVTNLPEIKHHSHQLETGISVWVFAWYDGGTSAATTAFGMQSGPPTSSDDNQKHYLMCLNPGRGRFVITGNSGKAGVYTAHALKAPTTKLPMGTATAPTTSDIGAAETATVYVANMSEYNKSGSDATQWDLASGQVVAGSYLMLADDNTPVFETLGFNLGNCS